MIEIKFDITNATDSLKVKSLIDNLYAVGASQPAPVMPVAPVAVTPVAPVMPVAPVAPVQAPVAPAPIAPVAPAPIAPAAVPPPAAPAAGVDLTDAGLQGFVAKVAQAGIPVPSILQELQACGATKVSELQPQMRQAFRDKLVALTGGTIQ